VAFGPYNQEEWVVLDTPFIATDTGYVDQIRTRNVPFHLGLKTYSDVGASALATLRDTYNWDITEQYQATYGVGTKATLVGEGTQSPLDSGATTTAVEVRPDNRCSFIEWSDGATANPRTDVLTDNLSVNAVISCSSPGGTSARTQVDRATTYGNEEQAELIEDRFINGESKTLDDTLRDVLTTVSELPNTVTPNDQDTVRELISVLLELVEALTKLLLHVDEEAVTG
jgi:hypothetical protein